MKIGPGVTDEFTGLIHSLLVGSIEFNKMGLSLNQIRFKDTE